MKSTFRLIAILLLSVLFITGLTISSSATTDWSTVTLSEYIKILNGRVETSNTVMYYGFQCMRGFAVSPDGKYAFGGFLNPAGTSAVTMFDLTTARPLDSYIHDQTDGGRSYPKGLAVDDRGYLYAGLAYYPNYGSADFSVVKYLDNGEMSEISYTNIVTIGKPGDKNGTKIGINGVDVQKIGDKYYVYFVVNYAIDFLYRFDVTDPTQPVLDTSFGTNGRVDLATKHSFTEGQYLDVDEYGIIYLGGATSTDSGLYVLSADGNTQLNHYSCSKGYAVGLWEDYIFVTTSSSPTAVHVLDKNTLAELATIPCHTGANVYVYVTVVDGILYVADQGASTADYDGIIVAPLTDEANTLLTQRKENIAALLAESLITTAAPETTASPVVTTTADTEAITTAVNDVTTTIKPSTTTSDVRTEKPKSGGCGSSNYITMISFISAAIVPTIIVKKKKVGI